MAADISLSAGLGAGINGQIPIFGVRVNAQWRWMRGELRRKLSASLDTCEEDPLTFRNSRKLGVNIGMDWLGALAMWGVNPVADIAGHLEYSVTTNVTAKTIDIWLGFTGTLKIGLEVDYWWWERFIPVDPQFNGDPVEGLTVFSHTFQF